MHAVLIPKPFTFYVSRFTNDEDGHFEHPVIRSWEMTIRKMSFYCDERSAGI
jgi:hypothetical protein